MAVGGEPQGAALAQHFRGALDERLAKALVLGAAIVEGEFMTDEVEVLEVGVPPPRVGQKKRARDP